MDEPIAAVRRYHAVTKHHPDRLAPGPGHLDWDTQPEPFRWFDGAPRVELPLVAGTGGYDDLVAGRLPARPPSLAGIGLFLELALGLSAWKVMGPHRWALRNNPSSGNLHPTEGHVLWWGPDLAPGLYHYVSRDHALERRARLDPDLAKELAASGSFGAFGLSTIPWREAWKYGARAWRYCQLDIGHALAAARLAAAVAGWPLTLDPTPADATVAACLGLDRAGDFAEAEGEAPDLLAVLGEGPAPDWSRLAAGLGDWAGQANRLSGAHVAWPQIDAVAAATVKPATARPAPAPGRAFTLPPVAGSAPDLIRQRRSAQRMDHETGLSRPAFERLLARTLPAPALPQAVLAGPPALNLLVFVHRVADLDPGLYGLIRVPQRRDAFRAACGAADLAWQDLDDTGLPLVRLRAPRDVRRLASGLCCRQGIAGRGAFSVGMIADLDAVLAAEGAWAYRRLYWEAGLIGQILYLEAEALGLRGTGIGCFFDDGVHDLLGLGDAWQDLYHFTVGGALEDGRLTTEPAYGGRARQELTGPNGQL